MRLRGRGKLTTVRRHDALTTATTLEVYRDPRDECGAVEPNMPWEIGVYRHIEHDRTGQLARPCSIERLGEEQRAVGTAANFSRGAWC
jgi:hypothetical protein